MRLYPKTVACRLTLICFATAGLAANTPSAQADCNGTNTCFGDGAMESNVNSLESSAFGFEALFSQLNATGSTAVGFQALRANLSSYNTAVGHFAMTNNTTGGSNTGIGKNALLYNTTGSDNTAIGLGAMTVNIDGNSNTAVGIGAMSDNHSGNLNSATGREALSSNETGNNNTANGAYALQFTTTGSSNTAMGFHALAHNSTGINNSAIGADALSSGTGGFRNVALGYRAGFETTGHDNIVIGAENRGEAVESGVIRIGTRSHQNRVFIAGIHGAQTVTSSATAVFVDARGKLGTIKSSARFKEDIQPMANVSERLFALRPVTFRYKQQDEDGSKPVQFGLIAEEVAKAFPELVIYDEEGQPETVRYDLVATLLLNEFQKERGVVAAQATELALLKREFAEMAAVIERLDKARIIATTD